jgi:hypothetical protein
VVQEDANSYALRLLRELMPDVANEKLTLDSAYGFDPPVNIDFHQRRRQISVNSASAIEDAPGWQGFRMTGVQTRETALQGRYMQWLRKHGFNGQNQGTLPEFQVFEWLERRGWRSPISDPPGLDFEFLVNRYIGYIKSALVDDFAEIDYALYNVSGPPIAMRVHGEIWHFNTADAIERDEIQRVVFEQLGYRVVDLLAQDTLNQERLNVAMELAIQGIEIDNSGRQRIFM